MAETTHAALRAQLEDERGRLHVQLEQMGYGGPKADYDEGFADSGQVTAERGEVDALAGSLLETLHDIDEALTKFDAGTYGVCENCQQPIPEARLEAMPAARLCIACASKRR
jgi:RNA polymerase-binding transcription factor DksA